MQNLNRVTKAGALALALLASPGAEALRLKPKGAGLCAPPRFEGHSCQPGNGVLAAPRNDPARLPPGHHHVTSGSAAPKLTLPGLTAGPGGA